MKQTRLELSPGKQNYTKVNIILYTADGTTSLLLGSSDGTKQIPLDTLRRSDHWETSFRAGLAAHQGPDSWTGFHPAMERIYVVMELGRDD